MVHTRESWCRRERLCDREMDIVLTSECHFMLPQGRVCPFNIVDRCVLPAKGQESHSRSNNHAQPCFAAVGSLTWQRRGGIPGASRSTQAMARWTGPLTASRPSQIRAAVPPAPVLLLQHAHHQHATRSIASGKRRAMIALDRAQLRNAEHPALGEKRCSWPSRAGQAPTA